LYSILVGLAESYLSKVKRHVHQARNATEQQKANKQFRIQHLHSHTLVRFNWTIATTLDELLNEWICRGLDGRGGPYGDN
jgi:hypothetical protein